MPPPPQFSTRKSLLFSALIVLAFFGVLEAGLRVVGVQRPLRPRVLLRTVDVDISFPFMRPDPVLFWAPRPGWQGRFLDTTVSINRLGLRGTEPALPKPRGRRWLVTFGDSITFGYGVDDGDTYTAELARLLAPRGVEAFNAGVTGYTSHQVLRRLQGLAPQVPMDVATFCIGWNDGNRRRIEDRAFESRLRLSMQVEDALDRLYLYRAAKAFYIRTAVRAEDSVADRQRVPLPHYEENLTAIVEECRRRGVQPVFVQLPHRRRRGEAKPVAPYAGVLEETARRLDVPLLRAPALDWDTARESNEEYFIDSLHFSAPGHRVMGQELARQLVARGLL